MICASNQNRSMEAHSALLKKGLDVHSFGTNAMIKMPGLTPEKPNSYPFGTTYEQIAADLRAKDAAFYTQNGLLAILDRNRKIKPAPQRFQLNEEPYDFIITCEERCFAIVCEGI